MMRKLDTSRNDPSKERTIVRRHAASSSCAKHLSLLGRFIFKVEEGYKINISKMYSFLKTERRQVTPFGLFFIYIRHRVAILTFRWRAR
jgi:hypothetical protein